jgi:hypothetical protein
MFQTGSQIGLEFAPRTSDECKRLVGRLFHPTDLLGAYRDARAHFGTGDLVLVTSEQDPSGFEPWVRPQYATKVAGLTRGKLPSFFEGLAGASAHSIVSLPRESEAFWLVITRRQTIPVMVVIYATPFKVAVGEN